MVAHVRHSHRERAAFALRRPDILVRKLLGRDLIEIGLAEIERYVPPNPVILEAGACDGTDTTRFAQRWPEAVIYSFEPVPALFEEAKRRTNGISGIRLYQLALSAASGTTVMHVIDPGEGGNRGTSSLLRFTQSPPEPQKAVQAQDIEVQTITMEDWAKAEGVNRIDLMWLDMEGAELSALRSAGPLLRTVRAICMEVSREERFVGSPVYEEVVSWMREQGFRIAIDRVTLWFGNILFVRG